MQFWLKAAVVAASLFASYWGGLTNAVAAEDFLEPEKAFAFSAKQLDDKTLEVNFKIAAGYYLYREQISAKADNPLVQLASPLLPKGVIKFDETFQKEVETYRDALSFQIPILAVQGPFKLQVISQGCADAGLCYPPMHSEQLFDLSGSSALANASNTSPQVNPSRGIALGNSSSVDKASEIEAIFKKRNLLAGVLVFFGIGLLLTFTPCVLPMVPILSSIIVGEGQQLTRMRGLGLSAVYVCGMAMVYTGVGVAAGMVGHGLTAVLQNPWVLVLFALLLVSLSLAMFGFYELQLPQSWQTRLMGSGARRSGSLGGAAIMGFGSALIVGPCVTPPLAAALVYVAQTGDVMRGALALFGLGLGMGLPLLAFGTFGAGALPRSGPWLARVKYVFGFIFIGLAIWMISRVIPAWSTVFLLGALISVGGLVLIGSQLLKAGTLRTFKTVLAGLGVIVIGCGTYLMIASANGSSERIAALAGYPTASAGQAMAFENVTTNDALDAAVRRAVQQGKPVMLDFSADWCVECKLMDRTVYSDPGVMKELKDFVVIRADATDYNDETRALLKRFSIVGPPTVIFLNPRQNKELPDTRFVGPVDAKTFTARLKQLRQI